MEGPVPAVGWTVETAYEHATARAIPPSQPGGDHQYRCPFSGCGKPFTKRFNLKAHLRVHTGDRPFVCSFAGCDRRFMWKSSLTSHEVGHSRRDAEGDRRPPLASRSHRGRGRTRAAAFGTNNTPACVVAPPATVRSTAPQQSLYGDAAAIPTMPNASAYVPYAPTPDMYAQYAQGQRNVKMQKLEHKRFRTPTFSLPLQNPAAPAPQPPPQHPIPTSNAIVPQAPLHPEFPLPDTKPTQNESTGLTPLFGPRGPDTYIPTSTPIDNQPQPPPRQLTSSAFPASFPASSSAPVSLPLVYTSNGQRTLTPPVPSTTAGVSPGTWFGSNYLPAPNAQSGASTAWLTGSNGSNGPTIKSEASKFASESNVLPPPVNAKAAAATSPPPVNSATVSPVPPPMLPQVSASCGRSRRPPKAPGLASGTLLPPIANMPQVNPPSHINLAGIGIVDADVHHTEMTPNLQAHQNSASPLPLESPIHGFIQMPISPLQPFSPSVLLNKGSQTQNW